MLPLLFPLNSTFRYFSRFSVLLACFTKVLCFNYFLFSSKANHFAFSKSSVKLFCFRSRRCGVKTFASSRHLVHTAHVNSRPSTYGRHGSDPHLPSTGYSKAPFLLAKVPRTYSGSPSTQTKSVECLWA